MADYYVEPKSYPAYAATPANSTTAYDGDGLAKGLATPAKVSIDLTAYTAAATNTFAVGGATLTCVASGATANQFNAGTGATLASNLASAINAATNVLAASSPAANWVAHQLRNVVYASAAGATLNIQTRAGSSVYNANSSFQCVSVGFTGGSQFAAQFANGVSGAWGCFFSDYDAGTMWPQAITASSYGIIFNGVTTTNCAPLAGPSAAISHDADVVHIRCNDKTLYASADNATGPGTVSVNRSAFYLFDDGTEWPTGAGYLNFNGRRQSSTFWHVLVTALNSKCSFVNRGGDWLTGLRIQAVNAGRSGAGIQPGNTASLLVENILFNDTQSTNIVNSTASSASDITIRGCKFVCTRNAFYQVINSFWSSSYPNSSVLIERCVFDFSSYSGADSYVIALVNGISSNTLSNCVIRDCQLIAASAGHTAVNTYLASGVVVENFRGVNEATNLNVLGSNSALNHRPVPYVIQQGILSAEHFRHENPLYIVDWNPNAAYPTYNSLLPSGGAWVVRLQWSNSANVEKLGGIEFFKRSHFITQSGMQKVVLEMLFDSALTPTNAHFGIFVTYTKNADSLIYTEATEESSLVRQTGATTLATSAAAWTKPGAYSTWVARKIELTLSGTIKQNTNIDVGVVFHKKSPSGVQSVFINPEVGVTA